MKHKVNELKKRVAEIATKAGIPAADAAMIAEVLVTTDMRGVHSHGVVRLARYLDCIKAGGIKAAVEPVTLNETPTSLMVSANGGLGIPAAYKTMERLLAKAEGQAVVCATMNHSDHYGAAGYYSMMAADRGAIGRHRAAGGVRKGTAACGGDGEMSEFLLLTATTAIVQRK